MAVGWCLLLENGVYLHTNNDERMSAMDSVSCPAFKQCAIRIELLSLMKKFDQSLTLKYMAAKKLRDFAVSYKDQLPAALANFVDLH